jgi:hypothetical protein
MSDIPHWIDWGNTGTDVCRYSDAVAAVAAAEKRGAEQVLGRMDKWVATTPLGRNEYLRGQRDALAGAVQAVSEKKVPSDNDYGTIAQGLDLAIEAIQRLIKGDSE